MAFRDEDVYAAVRSIPAGDVRTYGQVAEMLGADRRTSSRAVGQALARADDSIPWWRVVRRDGSMRIKGDPRQIRLLRAEGVDITADGRVASLVGRVRGQIGAPEAPTPDGLSSRISALKSALPPYASSLERALTTASSDPNGAARLLRSAQEQLLRGTFGREPDAQHVDLIHAMDGIAPERVIRHAHAVRLVGNQAVHDGTATPEDARDALHSAILVGEWAARQRGQRP